MRPFAFDSELILIFILKYTKNIFILYIKAIYSEVTDLFGKKYFTEFKRNRN